MAHSNGVLGSWSCPQCTAYGRHWTIGWNDETAANAAEQIAKHEASDHTVVTGPIEPAVRSGVVKRVCRLDGCGKPRYGRHSVCTMHRQRWQRHGSFELPEPAPRPARLCTYGDCQDIHLAWGYCSTHYHRAKFGRPMDGREQFGPDVLAEAEFLLDSGVAIRELMAQRLGRNLDTFDRALYRARSRGDERAARILARTERRTAA